MSFASRYFYDAMTVKERSYKQSVEISCHLAVGVVLERVNVEPKSSGKQNRILWNDRQPRPQRPEADFRVSGKRNKKQ